METKSPHYIGTQILKNHHIETKIGSYNETQSPHCIVAWTRRVCHPAAVEQEILSLAFNQVGRPARFHVLQVPQEVPAYSGPMYCIPYSEYIAIVSDTSNIPQTDVGSHLRIYI